MKVLKANYKIEEKNGMITSIDGHSQDEAKGLYWMYKINGEMAPKGAAETTVKKGRGHGRTQIQARTAQAQRRGARRGKTDRY